MYLTGETTFLSEQLSLSYLNFVELIYGESDKTNSTGIKTFCGIGWTQDILLMNPMLLQLLSNIELVK